MSTFSQQLNEILDQFAALAAGDTGLKDRPLSYQDQAVGQVTDEFADTEAVAEADEPEAETNSHLETVDSSSAKKKAEPGQPLLRQSLLGRSSLAQGIIMAEILGEPLARRRRRSRY